MEPPTKRPRFGPAPFDSFVDDPEADELNERPEDVNARRDPAVQLERSRAFAVFKLKSAFERIFEKYEKDFTGVGDEINLSTGEIVVDNGHVQSLKGMQLGGAEDEEEDGEDTDDAAGGGTSLNEEDRMMRGEVDRRLSRVGQQNALPSILPQFVSSPFFARGWLGQTPMLGGTPPGFPSMISPGQMPFGGFPLQYGTPITVPTTDPAWRTPELPSPFSRNALMSGTATPLIRKKTARLSSSAAREQDGADEDDILMDVSALEKENGKSEGSVVKQKLLAPHTPPMRPSVRQKKPPKKSPGTYFGRRRRSRKPDNNQQARKSPAVKKTLGSTPIAEQDTTPPGIPIELRTMSTVGVGLSEADTTTTPTETSELESTPVPAGAAEDVTEKDVPEAGQAVSDERQQLTRVEDEANFDREDPDVFVSVFDKEEKLTRIPRNQTLRVEIPAKKPPDVSSFRMLTPEPSEMKSLEPEESIADALDRNDTTPVSKTQDTSQPVRNKNNSADRKNRDKVSAEIFSRNDVDPAYNFSDEDEPTLPRRKEVQRRPSKQSLSRTNNTEAGVLREISHNVGPGKPEDKPQKDSAIESWKVNEPTVLRAPSPTLSIHREDVEDRHGNELLEALGGTGEPLPTPAGETPQRITNEKKLSVQTTTHRITRRMSLHQAESPLLDQPSLETPRAAAGETTSAETPTVLSEPKRRRRRRSVKTQPTEAPAKTPVKAGLDGSCSLKPLNRQEIPETSPNVQPTATPCPTRSPPAQILEARDADLPFPSEEQGHDISNQLNRAPSPTLTDPTSKPEPTVTQSPSASRATTAPRTPVKTTPTSRQPKKSDLPTSSTKPKPGTATATSTATKRRGLLSLLLSKTGADGHNSEEDELSILSPVKPPSTTRTTPAGHHVRLGLLVPGTVRSAPGTKLRQAVLAGSASGPRSAGRTSVTAGAMDTPTGRPGRKRGRRKSGLGAGLGEKTGDGPSTPSSRLRAQESELVQTPGGTMRRCGEGGFRCEREFCFSCL